MRLSYAIQACKLALDERWAINLGGGFSHYTTNTGGGLAVYDDVSVCLAVSFLLFLLLTNKSILGPLVIYVPTGIIKINANYLYNE